MKKPLHIDFIQLLCSVVGMIVFGIIGLLSGATLGGNTASGYEAIGALGGAIGVWLGSFAGVYLASRWSHTTGNVWLSLILSCAGATALFYCAIWFPSAHLSILLFIVPILAYIGWNWRLAHS